MSAIGYSLERVDVFAQGEDRVALSLVLALTLRGSGVRALTPQTQFLITLAGR